MNDLEIRQTTHSRVEKIGINHWRLCVDASPTGQYRWAQLDDYMRLPRKHFKWQIPFHLSLQARVSNQDLSGTWGFGFWNDPFAAGMGLGGMARRLPTLPQSIWFFYASPPNHLALRDIHPAQGMLMASFSSWKLPDPLLLPGILGFPLLLIRPVARRLRRLAQVVIASDTCKADIDLTQWHSYQIECGEKSATFYIDHQPHFETRVIPRGRLGLVIWIDNQYLAFKPDGTLRAGTLPTLESAWLEVRDILVSKSD